MGDYRFWCKVYKLILEARESLWVHVESKKPLFVPAAQLWAGGIRAGRNPACLSFSLLRTVELHTCVSSSFASSQELRPQG